jgi:hypothetical protein
MPAIIGLILVGLREIEFGSSNARSACRPMTLFAKMYYPCIHSLCVIPFIAYSLKFSQKRISNVQECLVQPELNIHLTLHYMPLRIVETDTRLHLMLFIYSVNFRKDMFPVQLYVSRLICSQLRIAKSTPKDVRGVICNEVA